MPGAGRAEFYFITAMMFLIVVLCVGAVYFFIKTYKKEMKEKAERQERTRSEGASAVVENENVAS
jgi:preprotein translocase subunit YajC